MRSSVRPTIEKIHLKKQQAQLRHKDTEFANVDHAMEIMQFQYQNYDQIVKDAKRNGFPWADDVFKASRQSLCPDEDLDKFPIKGDAWRGVEWIRSFQIPELTDHNGEQDVFVEGIIPDDIKQGKIQNCYFLSTISCLSEHNQGQRIRDLFVVDSTTYSPQGVYCMQFYKNGMPLEVVVDDYIPCEWSVQLFTKANGHELWVALLEKAWAKVHGSYMRCAFGLTHETMRDLTGAPGYMYDIQKEKATIF